MLLGKNPTCLRSLGFGISGKCLAEGQQAALWIIPPIFPLSSHISVEAAKEKRLRAHHPTAPPKRCQPSTPEPQIILIRIKRARNRSCSAAGWAQGSSPVPGAGGDGAAEWRGGGPLFGRQQLKIAIGFGAQKANSEKARRQGERKVGELRF